MDPIQLYNQINIYGKENGMKLIVHEPGHISYEMTVMEKHLSSHGTPIAEVFYPHSELPSFRGCLCNRV